eukprot:Rhum_TRINITY_DN11713_c2_g1::Rhum_TRINITY_DN11713_c2_g1_i1::g.46471::m.46471
MEVVGRRSSFAAVSDAARTDAASSKQKNELEYLRDLLAYHVTSREADEKLYYLCKNYTAQHRITVKHHKGELRKSKMSRRLGKCDELVSLGDGRMLMIGASLPVQSPVLITNPTTGTRVACTFRSNSFSRQLWVNITDHADGIEAGRWSSVRWEEQQDQGHTTTRDSLILFFEQPFSSRKAKAFFIAQVVLILLSVVALCMETVPRYNPELMPEHKVLWVTIEIVVTVVFTLETAARIALQRERLRFIKKPTVIADILAVLPFYLEEIFEAQGDGTDVLKLFRLFRMMKFFRNFRPIENLVRALEKSAQALIAPFVFLTACSLVVSSALYFCERGEYDPVLRQYLIRDPSCPAFFPNDTNACGLVPSKFVSIPHTLWWSIVTMTTVGYGDMVPVTVLGKVVGGISMILGIMFMAMPIAIVGSYFTVVVDVTQGAKGMEKAGLGGDAESAPGTINGIGGLLSSPRAGGLSSLGTPLSTGGRRMLAVASLPQAVTSPRAAATRDAKKEVKEALAGTTERSSDEVARERVREAERDAGGDQEGQSKGERLSTFLLKVMPEHDAIWQSSTFIHHSDIWLDALSLAADENNSSVDSKTGMTWRVGKTDAGGLLPSFGCLELAGRPKSPGEFPPTTAWLTRPIDFTIGARCQYLPDPDIVLAEEATFENPIAQRHAEIAISKWWLPNPTVKLRPCLPNKVYANGRSVPPEGVVLKNKDIVAFAEGNGSLKYVFRDDQYCTALNETSGRLDTASLLLPKPTLACSSGKSSRPPRLSGSGRRRSGGLGGGLALGTPLTATPSDSAFGPVSLLCTPTVPNPLGRPSFPPSDATAHATIHVGSVESDEDNMGQLSTPLIIRKPPAL